MAGLMSRYRDGLGGWGLLVLRLAVGTVFIMHGWQKLLVTGLPDVAGLLELIGFKPPDFWAALLTFSELAGGFALIVGIWTRLAAFVLGVTMVVAISTVLGPKGFFLPGYEFELTLLAVCVALLMTGPGRYAVDARLGLEA